METGDSATASLTGGNSKYKWSLSDAGTGFMSAPADGASDVPASAASRSRLVVNGDLAFEPTTIDVVGLTGITSSFDNAKYYSWTVATATSVTSANATPTFNSTGLDTGGGSFHLSSSATNVFVSFTPAPEPASILLGCAVAAGLTGFVRRQRARRQVTSS